MPEAQLEFAGVRTLSTSSALVNKPFAVLRQSNALPEDLGMLEPGQYFILESKLKNCNKKTTSTPTKERQQEKKLQAEPRKAQSSFNHLKPFRAQHFKLPNTFLRDFFPLTHR